MANASLVYLPALDGLRAISVVLVVVSHAGFGHLVPGGLGVIVFFSISGFLLTRQMIIEVESTGQISIRSFYIRRLFRLAPALLIYLALFNTVLGILGATITTPDILAGVFYVANYYDIFVGFSVWSPAPILWSLAVEEHYYLVFPWVVRAFRADVAKLLPWLAAVTLLVALWRGILYEKCALDPGDAFCGLPDSFRIFHGTDTMIDCILWGAMAAIALHFHAVRTIAILVNRRAVVMALVALLGCLLLRDPWFRDTARYSIEAAAASVIILNVLFGPFPTARRLLSAPIIVLIGRLSYSIYLFHYGVLMVVKMVWNIHGELYGFVPEMVYFGTSLILASMCYVLVERPMITLRRRLGSRTR